MPITSLTKRQSKLAQASEQLRVLESNQSIPSFNQILESHGQHELTASGIDVLQINVGKVCNQTCAHCHVDAGPDRRETMSEAIASECLRVLKLSGIPTLDITGGAPEMNPQFRRLVTEAVSMGKRVIDRCNLTILLAPKFDDLPQFLADNRVEIVASLPCYLQENVDHQRGNDTFRKSIEALKRLNRLGYGLPSSSLSLSLVYNPVGFSLPPSQTALEADYRRELRDRYGIEFTKLFTITNMPISRFLEDLLTSGFYDEYMQKLWKAFNAATLEGVMCRTMLSVDWLGNLFDCDFNQMLELGLKPNAPRHIRDLDESSLRAFHNRSIATGRHCLGCTAGAGSSCQGSLQK
jgi:radical SAM/Cys-rich protein